MYNVLNAPAVLAGKSVRGSKLVPGNSPNASLKAPVIKISPPSAISSPSLLAAFTS